MAKEIKKGEIIIYKIPDKKINLDVKLEQDTVWLSLNQIAEVFDTDKSGISRHIKNTYNTGELSKKATVAKIATVQIEGGRKIERNIEYYNLDIILSVGYKVNSKRATQFRIWATKIFKETIDKNNYKYENTWSGDVDYFSGQEKIFIDEKEIYVAQYSGGLVDM